MMDYHINPDGKNLPLFDHKSCKWLLFGQSEHSVNERVEPNQACDEIYMRLEHLDPQNLHIGRWSKGRDVIGTSLRFWKGSLIFGRRRTYQRKLAVVEFASTYLPHAQAVVSAAFVHYQPHRQCRRTPGPKGNHAPHIFRDRTGHGTTLSDPKAR